jgi:hypothetical protein
MLNLRVSHGIGRLLSALALILVVSAPAAGREPDKVTTFNDEDGWKLQVNGEDYYIKGVVWGYTPKNENYAYNLWGQSEDYIRKVIDYDFALMKAAGVNTIRSFASIPPEWVTYIYQEYGIMTVINPLMGRYGHSVGGKWVPVIDYSDLLTRLTLKADTVKLVERYKDTPGVLMFAFGNESNYGLSWSSYEIENLPVGEQEAVKAVYLYSLFNDVIMASKKIAPDHLFTIVNGDLQYIDLIVKLCPELDLLGSNAYRGKNFTALWKDVHKKLDLPVALFEFGSDAFNAKTGKEDEKSQARFFKTQWQDMYANAYGNGRVGNSIGGFVFEWRDEWWKFKQTENLNVHDDNASWANGGYSFDWINGKNNMNEEWFGINALGAADPDGVYLVRPRIGYEVLSQVWRLDPYALDKRSLSRAFKAIDIDDLAKARSAKAGPP